MITRDFLGNLISQGDTVGFSLATGTVVPATIERISAGLDGTPPTVFLRISIPLPIMQNGVVAGIQAIAPNPISDVTLRN